MALKDSIKDFFCFAKPTTITLKSKKICMYVTINKILNSREEDETERKGIKFNKEFFNKSFKKSRIYKIAHNRKIF